ASLVGSEMCIRDRKRLYGGDEAPERCRTSDRRGCASSFLTREAGSSSWPGQELCGSPLS
ncbi:hypothetical protein FA131_09195, partial [Pseudomonas aeruginosa]|nr:hypothetical protein [Pseudomonas aeruginosa]